jgi:hypothetical protein
VKDLYTKLKWKKPIESLREYCQYNPLAETDEDEEDQPITAGANLNK